MISTTLTATNGHRSSAPSWQRETVQAFFEGVPWSGMPTHQATSSGTASADGLGADAPLAMTVGQFFEMMSWEGKPTIGVLIAPLEAPAPVTDTPSEDLTLDDFSSLFG